MPHAMNFLPSLIVSALGISILAIQKGIEIFKTKTVVTPAVERPRIMLTTDECHEQWRAFHQNRYDTFQRRYRLALQAGVAQAKAYYWAHDASQYHIADPEALRALCVS